MEEGHFCEQQVSGPIHQGYEGLAWWEKRARYGVEAQKSRAMTVVNRPRPLSWQQWQAFVSSMPLPGADGAESWELLECGSSCPVHGA